MAGPLVDIRDLRVLFHGDDGRTTHAVDSVDLSVANGATLGLVGESGCGKSVTSLAIMGLLPKRSAEVSGAIRFDGFDLLTACANGAQPCIAADTRTALATSMHAHSVFLTRRLWQAAATRYFFAVFCATCCAAGATVTAHGTPAHSAPVIPFPSAIL